MKALWWRHPPAQLCFPYFPSKLDFLLFFLWVQAISAITSKHQNLCQCFKWLCFEFYACNQASFFSFFPQYCNPSYKPVSAHSLKRWPYSLTGSFCQSNSLSSFYLFSFQQLTIQICSIGSFMMVLEAGIVILCHNFSMWTGITFSLRKGKHNGIETWKCHSLVGSSHYSQNRANETKS